MTNTKQEWEEWVRTLAASRNPHDVELLIAKIEVLLTAEKEASYQEGLKRAFVAVEETIKAVNEFSGEGFVSPEMKDFAKIALNEILQSLPIKKEEV